MKNRFRSTRTVLDVHVRTSRPPNGAMVMLSTICDPPAIERATELEERVLPRLLRQVRDFRIVLVRERIILRGKACSYYAKQMAQEAVMKVTRLPIQKNEIEVCPCPLPDQYLVA